MKDLILGTLFICFLAGLIGVATWDITSTKRAEQRLYDTYLEKRVRLKGSKDTFGICIGVENQRMIRVLTLGNPPVTVVVPPGAVELEVE